jgi:hypothetical protein
LLSTFVTYVPSKSHHVHNDICHVQCYMGDASAATHPMLTDYDLV